MSIGRPGPGLGVRGKLFALVLVLIIPVLLLNAVGVYIRYENQVDHELQQSQILADAVSMAFVNHLDSLWNMELAVGSALTISLNPRVPDEMETLLRETVNDLPTIMVLTWADADGTIVASSHPDRRGIQLADRDYFQEIVAGADKVVSDVIMGRISDQPIVVVGRAVRTNGQLMGVLLATMDLNRLEQVLPVAHIEGWRFGFLDRNGRLVYRNDNPVLSLEERETAPDCLGRGSRWGETVLLRSFRERPGDALRMGLSVPLRNLGWAFFASVTHRAVMADIWTHMVRDVAVLLLVATVSLLWALYIGRGILRPMMALQRAARAISAGDLGARVELDGSDEIAATAQTFDSMASRVQLADEVLKARVTAVAHLSQQALAGADLDGLADAAAALVALSLGIEAAAVVEILPTTEQLRIRAAVGLPEGLQGRCISRGYDYVAAQARERKEPFVVENVPVKFFEDDMLLGDARIATAAVVPIIDRDQPFGILVACSGVHAEVTRTDLHFMQAVANVVASAIGRKRVEAEQALLVGASSVLAGSLDVRETLSGVAQLATEFMADWCLIDLGLGGMPLQIVRSSRTELRPVAAAYEQYMAKKPPAWQTVTERVRERGTIFRSRLTDELLQQICGSDEELLAILRSMAIVSSIVVPLVARDQVLGMVSLMTSDPRGYGAHDQELAQELARRASLAVDHAQMYGEATRALAARDSALAKVESERARLHTLFEQAPSLIEILRGPQHVVVMANQRALQSVGGRPIIGRPLAEALPELASQGFMGLLDQVYATGIPYEGTEIRIMMDRRGTGALDEGVFNFVYQPMADSSGQVEGILVYTVDVTEQVRSRRQVEDLATDLRTVAEQQAAIAMLGQRLIGGADIRSLLAESVELVARVLGVDNCAILELLPDGQQLRVQFGKDWSGGRDIPLQAPNGRMTNAGFTLTSGQPVIISDARRETRFEVWPGLIERGVVSSAHVLIPGEVEPYGILGVHALSHRRFTPDDVNFLLAAAHVVSRALQHQRDQQRLNTQHAVARALAEAAGENTICLRVLQALGDGLGWDVGLFWLVDRETGTARCTDTWQASGIEASPFLEHCRGVAASPGEGLVGMVWQQAQPVWIADVTDYQGFLREKAAALVSLHGALLIPVMLGDEVLGVIECFSREVRRPIRALISMATTIGSQVGQFLQRQRAETELRQLNAELELRVADRTAELRAANQELEAFAYSVSHDLRAPLRTIDGFSQALAEDCGTQVGDEGLDFIRRIRTATKNMAGLIDDILRLSRVMRQEIRRERVNLSAVARSVVGELRRERPERDVSVTVADGLIAYGDERLLRLVVRNLLANAWKFTGRTPRAEITFGSEKQHGKTVYFVRDNGAGFDMAYIDKLFVPFQRLHPASDFEGTGIGLATVQRIIQRHGGQVWAEGQVGQGATFFFTL